jgi:hypothetical protein
LLSAPMGGLATAARAGRAAVLQFHLWRLATLRNGTAIDCGDATVSAGPSFFLTRSQSEISPPFVDARNKPKRTDR